MTRFLEVKNLEVSFPITGGIFSRTVGHVRAVRGVSFELDEGETLGIVGESGCGKTTTGLAVLRLIEPTGGKVLFKGRELRPLNRKELRNMRREMQIIFQDPYASLNPRMKIGDIIADPLRMHGVSSRKDRDERVFYLLDKVGLHRDHADRYPHELSGGQRQRIGIARALALGPDLIVADEPVSALDVSIQAQIVNLMRDLQEEFEISYIMISHDLAVVEHMADRVAVMYLGQIVEQASWREIYKTPRHPYTQALLKAVPVPDPARRRSREQLKGDVPSPSNPPPGCAFQTRCPKRMDICASVAPPVYDVGGGHCVACHLYEGEKEH